jgi:Phosphoadenosine phosphosulfate reductase family
MTKRFISFSGGVESTTLCLLYGANANAIFADTGFEHEKLYERLDIVQEAVRKFHNNDFQVIKLKSKHGTLPEYIEKQKFYPSFNARFCTRLFKIEPIDNYLKQFEEDGVELMIGLNYDEAKSRVGNHATLPFVNYSYPLIQNGITRKMCEEILNKADLHPNFPVYMRRGGCVGCFYKSKKEYEAMVHLSPDEFDTVIALEESIQDKRGKFYHVKKDIPSLRMFKEEIQSQPFLFKPEEVYATVNNETSCGIFCNR